MKRIIITIILFLGFLGIFFGLTWQEYQELKNNLATSRVRQTDIDNKINYSLGMEEITRTLKRDYEQEDEKLAASLPDDHYVPSLLSNMEDISRASGMAIDHFGGFDVHEYEEAPHLNRIELDIALQGGYENFKYFTSGLESLSRTVSLREIRIERTQAENGAALDYSIIIDTFSY